MGQKLSFKMRAKGMVFALKGIPHRSRLSEGHAYAILGLLRLSKKTILKKLYQSCTLGKQATAADTW